MKVEQPSPRAQAVLRRDPNNGMRVVVFSALLFLSGIGALIFETLWLRLSGLVQGEIRSGNQRPCLAANVSAPLRAQHALPFRARVDCHFEPNEG